MALEQKCTVHFLVLWMFYVCQAYASPPFCWYGTASDTWKISANYSDLKRKHLQHKLKLSTNLPGHFSVKKVQNVGQRGNNKGLERVQRSVEIRFVGVYHFILGTWWIRVPKFETLRMNRFESWVQGRRFPIQFLDTDTVDGRNPAPPNM